MTATAWLGSTCTGLRVLDLSSNIAGPLAAMILGDLGADVVKVERPGRGDDTRGLPPSWQGVGTVFHAVNRNKRSVALDLRSDAGRAALLALAERADVVVESFGPGVADRLGLGYEAIRARSPAIIHASVSAFGDGEIGRRLPGYDSLIQGFSGMMGLTGHPDGAPARVAPSSIDISTGLWIVIGILAALRQRAEDGASRRVEAALVDAAFLLMGHQVMGLQATGLVPPRLGTASPSSMPNGAFEAADGWVVVATANDRQFARLCAALERPELATDPRFATPVQRVAHREALDALLAPCFRTRPAADWIGRLREAGVAAGPLQDLGEALAHPLTAERGLLVDVPGADLRQLRLPIDGDASGVRRRPPGLGEHTDEVLGEAGIARPADAP